MHPISIVKMQLVTPRFTVLHTGELFSNLQVLLKIIQVENSSSLFNQDYVQLHWENRDVIYEEDDDHDDSGNGKRVDCLDSQINKLFQFFSQIPT